MGRLMIFVLSLKHALQAQEGTQALAWEGREERRGALLCIIHILFALRTVDLIAFVSWPHY